jgi:hypothetical protein
VCEEGGCLVIWCDGVTGVLMGNGKWECLGGGFELCDTSMLLFGLR